MKRCWIKDISHKAFWRDKNTMLGCQALLYSVSEDLLLIWIKHLCTADEIWCNPVIWLTVLVFLCCWEHVNCPSQDLVVLICIGRSRFLCSRITDVSWMTHTLLWLKLNTFWKRETAPLQKKNDWEKFK